ELAEKDNTSIQVMAECLAAEVALAHFPARFELIGEPFVWIEYHQAVRTLGRMAVYLWVTFDSYAPRQVLRFDGRRRVALGQSHWTRRDPACIEELIAVQRETPERSTPVPAIGQIRAA